MDIETKNEGRCEVCGEVAPPGHRFCDNCWPEAAIVAGFADRCEVCDTPKVTDKLHRNEQGQLICAKH